MNLGSEMYCFSERAKISPVAGGSIVEDGGIGVYKPAAIRPLFEEHRRAVTRHFANGVSRQFGNEYFLAGHRGSAHLSVHGRACFWANKDA